MQELPKCAGPSLLTDYARKRAHSGSALVVTAAVLEDSTLASTSSVGIRVRGLAAWGFRAVGALGLHGPKGFKRLEDRILINLFFELAQCLVADSCLSLPQPPPPTPKTSWLVQDAQAHTPKPLHS